MTQGKTVFVGLSGGVDSSVAATRLIAEGYNVVGVFIKVWQPDFLNCNWEAERLDAMRVAAKLGIQFLTCDAVDAYKQDVADYFIHEYKNGRTPNPDVMCNKYVKFGAFLDYALSLGADYVATGHYAQKTSVNGQYVLLRGKDTNKDQSYFLWTLTQEQLKYVLLPIGNSHKAQIRAEASANQLTTAEKKDSQGICFLGQVDIPEFLSHYIELVPGNVLNAKGSVIGEHKGALVYTIGQRHGFSTKTDGDSQLPHYVVARDIANNTITVSTEKPSLQSFYNIVLTDCNFINYMPTVDDELEIQTRYRQKPVKARAASWSETRLQLELTELSESISVGQSCVLYKGEQCLGGGIIS